MTDRPILFSGPMVRSIAERRKKQTRRVLRTWNNVPFENLAELESGHYSGRDDDPDSWGYPFADDGAPMGLHGIALSQCVVGDRLYVREAWRVGAQDDRTAPRDLPRQIVGYEADCAPGQISATGRLRPGMHMPRWASRTTLMVSDVRVQRLQEIGEEDAMAEGCGQYASSTILHRDRPFTPEAKGSYREGFSELWEGLNAKRGFGWDANPWVVAVTFTVHHANIDTLPERIAA